MKLVNNLFQADVGELRLKEQMKMANKYQPQIYALDVLVSSVDVF